MEMTPDQALDARISELEGHLAHIKRNMEKLIAENRRMREVVRLAESELRKRRDQVRALEGEVQRLQNDRLEAKARVENAIDRLDELMREKGEAE